MKSFVCGVIRTKLGFTAEASFVGVSARNNFVF
jgi:hypothetical protein